MKSVVRCIAIVASMVFGLGDASAQIPTQMADVSTSPPAPPAITFDNSQGVPILSDEPGWNWKAGAQMIAIVPRFESNPAYTTTTTQSTGPGSPLLTSRNFQEFQYDYALSSRIWLGAESKDGVGVRVRWWQYDQTAPTLQVANSPIPLGSATLVQTVASQSPLMAIGTQTSLPAVLSLQQQGVANSKDVLS